MYLFWLEPIVSGWEEREYRGCYEAGQHRGENQKWDWELDKITEDHQCCISLFFTINSDDKHSHNNWHNDWYNNCLGYRGTTENDRK